MQRDLKKLFAYSSIAHVGLIAAGVFTLSVEGIQGSLVQMLAHGINVVGLFFCADIILNRKGTLQIHQLGGIRLQSPWFAAFFLIVVLGAVALPLTNGFVGEFMLLYSLFKYNVWLGAVAGTSIILGAVYMLKMYQTTILGDTTEHSEPMEALHWNEKVVLIGIVSLIFILGIFPGIVTNLTQPAIDQLIKLI
jgi:NADH-quinone oxidoreductase subunit M